MTGGIVEHEQTLCKTVREALEDVDRVMSLLVQVFRVKPPVAIFSRLKENARLPSPVSVKVEGRASFTHSFSSFKRPHSSVRKSETMMD